MWLPDEVNSLGPGLRSIQSKKLHVGMYFNLGSMNFLGLFVKLCVCTFFPRERMHSLHQIFKGVCDSKKVEPLYLFFKRRWVIYRGQGASMNSFLGIVLHPTLMEEVLQS